MKQNFTEHSKLLQLLLLFLLLSTGATGQINHALTATSAHSGGGATTYDASNYNDNVISAYGSLPWGWVTSNGWIEYTWNSAVAINAVKFYKDNRPMTTCTLQYWNGSAYVNIMNYNSTAIDDSVTFNTIFTTKLRFFNLAGGSNPNFREIQALYISQSPNDAGIAAVDSPKWFCPGTYDVKVKLQNFGKNKIDSVKLNWTWNGTAESQINYTSVLDTVGGSGNTTAQIKLGTKTFSANSTNTLKVWTSSPNGVADTSNLNDTITHIFKPSISGSYTVGGSGADYSTLAAAVADLNNFGVCGPVTFNINKGTYTGQVLLNNVQGASATNTITFKGAGIDSTILTHNATSTAVLATVQLNGTDYVRFSNMTIKSTNQTNGVGILLTNKADYNIFRSIKVEMNALSTGTLTSGIAITASTTSPSTYGDAGNYNIFDSLFVDGAYYGIRLNGTTTTSGYCIGNEVRNSEFTRQHYYGIMPYYQNSLVLHNNTVHNMRNTITYGIYVYYCSDITVTNNKVVSNYEALRLHYINRSLSKNARSFVHNNILQSGSTYYAVYSTYSDNINFHHNTLVNSFTTGTAYFGNNGNLNAQNNIFVNRQTGATSNAVYITGSTINNFDYNVYHTSGGTFVFHNSAIANLAAWQAAFPALNANSRVANPPFISANNLRLDPTVNFFRGANVGIADDVDGQARCIFAPSVGADESFYPEPTPIANFGSADTIWVNSPFIFGNVAGVNDAKAHKWYLNGVFQSSALHFKYVPLATGKDTIKLVTQSCGGYDSITKIVNVEVPNRKPDAMFITDKYTAEIFEGVTFSDLSTFGPVSWEWFVSPPVYTSQFGPLPTYSFLNGTSEFSQNPVIAFDDPGTYTITLVATNSQGSDTTVRVRYVVIRASANMCIFPFVSNVPSGTLYDDGGATGNYSAGKNGLNTCYYLIDPCAGSVTLNLTQFDLNTGDFLRVYDGADNKGTPLWNISAYPNGMNGAITNASVLTTLVANSGKMYIEFQSDNSTATVAAGFTGQWTSTPGNFNAPVAAFAMPDTVCSGIPVNFQNLSTGVSVNYTWDADNDGIADASTTDFTYTFLTTGTYKVTLTAENCGGSHAVSKTFTVIAPAHAPKPSFVADVRRPNTGEVVNFFDATTYCTDSWKWEITPGTFSFVTGSSAQSQHPQVIFHQPGQYDVKLVTGNSSGKDSILVQQYIYAIQFCRPSVATLNADLGISRFMLRDIDNKSAIGEYGYTDYTQYLSATLQKGATYSFSMDRNTSNNPMNRKVWIDFNQDGDFDDAGELVGHQTSSYSPTWVDSFTVPSNALSGATRMRIGTSYGNLSNTPCGPNAYGEFEDYRIIISPDVTVPVLVITGADTITIEQCRTYVDAGATALDNVDGDITSQIITIGLPVDTCIVGLHTITFTAEDASGNIATAVRVVIVIADTTNPVLVLQGNNPDTTEVYTSWNEPGYSATDNVDGNLTSSVIVAGNVDTSVLGTYIITYSVSDAQNNTTTETRTVVVVDTEDPVITLTGADTVYVEVGGTFTEPGATATDNYDTANIVTVTGTVDVNTVGTYYLEYCTEDQSGNRACSTRTVIVQDTEAPVATLIGSDTVLVEVYSSFTDPGINVTDNYYTSFNITTSGTWDGVADSLGDFTIIYHVTDGSGNTTALSRTVHVVDTKRPGIELKGDAVVFLNRWENWTDPGVLVDDNYDTNPRVDTTGNFTGTLVEGVFFRSYQAFDQSGNASRRVTRTIYVTLNNTTSVGNKTDVKVNLYPNPNRGNFKIEVELHKVQNVQLSIIDVSGRTIKTLHNGSSTGGSFDVTMESAKQGVYFIRLQSTEIVVVKKFIIVD